MTIGRGYVIDCTDYINATKVLEAISSTSSNIMDITNYLWNSFSNGSVGSQELIYFLLLLRLSILRAEKRCFQLETYV